MTRVMIVDEADDLTGALASKSAPDVAFVKITRAAIATASVEPPDLVLVYVACGGAGDASVIGDAIARWPSVPVVAIVPRGSQEGAIAAFRAGASGYVVADEVLRSTSFVVAEATAGRAPVSSRVARDALRWIAVLPEDGAGDATELTARELDVLRALAASGTYDDVARALGISVNTLRAHVRSLYRKLAVVSRTEAVVAALQRGWIDRRR